MCTQEFEFFDLVDFGGVVFSVESVVATRGNLSLFDMHGSLVRTLQHTATHCNTLQHTATRCNTLQHTATHCNTLQHTDMHDSLVRYDCIWELWPYIWHITSCVAVCCSVLQCVAACCSVLQCVAVCCTLYLTYNFICEIWIHKDKDEMYHQIWDMGWLRLVWSIKL